LSASLPGALTRMSRSCSLGALGVRLSVADILLSVLGARAPAHADVFPAVVAERPLAKPAQLAVLRGHHLCASSAQLDTLVHDPRVYATPRITA
jgi:hypothetical protein